MVIIRYKQIPKQIIGFFKHKFRLFDRLLLAFTFRHSNIFLKNMQNKQMGPFPIRSHLFVLNYRLSFFTNNNPPSNCIKNCKATQWVALFSFIQFFFLRCFPFSTITLKISGWNDLPHSTSSIKSYIFTFI